MAGVNLDSQSIPNAANFATNSGENTEEVKGINQISTMHITEGVAGTSEASDAQGINVSSGIPVLEAPNSLEEVLNTVVKISPESAKLLGVAENTAMNIADFNKAILDKLDTKLSTTKGLDVSKMDAGALDLFCMLLTQSSKEKMIQTFKDLLNTKIQERNEKQDKYLQELNKITGENIEAVEKAKAAEKRAKRWGIFKAIFSAIVAVVTAIVSVAMTVASFGALGPVAGALMVGACVLCIAAALATCASNGLSIAAMCTDDPEKKEALSKWSMGFGIGAAASGIVSALVSGGANVGAAMSAFAKVINGIGSVASGLSQVASGTLDVLKGIDDMELADLQRDLANMKIDLTKLDETIALLNKLIDALTNASDDLIKNLLEGEEQAAKELINIAQSQSELADGITAKGI